MDDINTEQLALILEMINGGTFSGKGVCVVAELKVSVEIELNARDRAIDQEIDIP